jgi:hypothetical protein
MSPFESIVVATFSDAAVIQTSCRGPLGWRPVNLVPISTTLVAASVVQVHRWWAWVWIVSNGLAGAWSLLAAKFPALRKPLLWKVVIAVQITVFVQVLLGVWMYNREQRTVEEFHMFYGFLGIITVAIMYSYRQSMRHRIYLLYGFGGLFIMGLGIRALLIGPLPS